MGEPDGAWLYPRSHSARGKKRPSHTGGQGCQASWGKRDAPGAEGPRGPRGRAHLASHSPMAVRTAETMTTASKRALILPQHHLTCCCPTLLASEARPVPAADNPTPRGGAAGRPAHRPALRRREGQIGGARPRRTEAEGGAAEPATGTRASHLYLRPFGNTPVLSFLS